MAGLIVKSPYIKGGGRGGYLKYIGTRDGVELLPSGYMEYMSGRPRSHGLFGDTNPVDMSKAINEVNQYSGNIWTHIFSLKREDAERLGYDHARQWQNLLRAHRNDIAAAMHIPPGDFRWYAAFHDEGEHPHVHMMAWSVKPGQAHLNQDGIRKIKSALTNDIFRQELLHTYEQKTELRNELVQKSRRAMRELSRQMQAGTCDSPEIERLMLKLSAELETVRGKKQYGYLPKKVKATVNELVNELEKLPAVNRCYQTWWELQCEIMDRYSEQDRELPKLSEQKEFRSVKNAVIQAAEMMQAEVKTFALAGNGVPEELPSILRDAVAQHAAVQAATKLLHHMGKIFQDAPMPRDATTMRPRIDRKRMAQLREKKLAMGQRPDDNGNQDFSMGGMS